MNMRRGGNIFFAMLCSMVLLFGNQSFAAYKPQTVLFLSFDALDIRSVSQLKEKGLLPELSTLHLVPLIGGPVSVTKPGHSEVLTGLSYAVTGIRTNEDFDSKIQPEWTIFGIMRRSFPESFISAVFSKLGHTGDSMVGSRHQPYYFLAQWAKSGGMNAYFNASELGHDMTIDETKIALNQQLDQYLEWHRSTRKWQYFIYVHFAEPDDEGHRTGMGSEGWNAKVIELDSILAALREKLRPELVIVYSDHGFNRFGSKGHNAAPKGLLGSSVRLESNGMRWDVVPTICEILGLPWKSYQPALMGRSLWIK